MWRRFKLWLLGRRLDRLFRETARYGMVCCDAALLERAGGLYLDLTDFCERSGYLRSKTGAGRKAERKVRAMVASAADSLYASVVTSSAEAVLRRKPEQRLTQARMAARGMLLTQLDQSAMDEEHASLSRELDKAEEMVAMLEAECNKLMREDPSIVAAGQKARDMLDGGAQ